MSGDNDDVFEYGDQTTFRLRDQEFMVDDLSTVASVPVPDLPATDVPADPPPPPAPTDLARIDQKLDAIVHAIEALQRRVDSIDAMIARVLTR